MKAPSKCPCCNGQMHIQTVHCAACDTTVKNAFDFSVFDSLSEEQTKFLLSFVGCEGNIKEMEKILSISYPTVKSRLQAIKQVLKIDTPVTRVNFMEILEQLENGKLTAQEAAKIIKGS